MYTADAKLGFDDNASFRQRSIFDMEDTTESEPREVEAAKHNLNYVQVNKVYLDHRSLVKNLSLTRTALPN